MKNSRYRLNHILLAAAVALPLMAGNQAARAGEADGGPAPSLRGGPPPFGPAAGPVFAPGGEGPRFDGPGHPGHGVGPGADFAGGARLPWLHRLDLSEAQEDKVFAILHAEQPYLREQDKAAAKAQAALRALATAEKYDDASAAALAQAAATAHANIALQHVRTAQKLLAVLTPEQRKQLAERQARHQPPAEGPSHTPREQGRPAACPNLQSGGK